MKKDSTIRAQTARKMHPDCVVCSADDPLGLGIAFDSGPDGTTSATIQDGAWLQGYPDQLHGGIISMLFDAAMTHCLFAHGLSGVTASLHVRFLQPVIPDRPVTVSARVKRQKSCLHLLEGTLQQDGEVRSTAEAKFWVVSRRS